MDRSMRSIVVVLGASVAILAAGCVPCPSCPVCPKVAPPPPRVKVAKPAPEPVAPPPPSGPPTIVVRDVGLQMPKSVLWDAGQDVYFVSNINGESVIPNKNGFLSKIAPDGKVIALKFVDGSKKASELNAPKGMAIIGDILYVADISVVRKFDRKSGKAKGEIKVPNAIFLNDLSASPDGKTLYVSDSAVTFKAGGFAGTGNDAIYAINVKKGSAAALISDEALHWPSGLLADEDGVWVVALGANHLFHVDQQGGTGPATKLPKGGLDGIVKLGDGSFLISSWEASAIYRGFPRGEFKEVISGIPSPADIGLDSKRNTLLIPIFQKSAVQFVPLPPLTPPVVTTPAPSAGPAPTAPPAAVPPPRPADVAYPVLGPTPPPSAPAPAAPPAPVREPPPAAAPPPPAAVPSAPAARPPAPSAVPAAPAAPAPAPWGTPYNSGNSVSAPAAPLAAPAGAPAR
jgi:sugar lactone lactonase YvrE